MMIGNEVQSALGQPSKIIEMSTNDLSTERFKKKILQPRNHFKHSRKVLSTWQCQDRFLKLTFWNDKSIHQVQHYPSISSEPHVQPVLQYREL